MRLDPWELLERTFGWGGVVAYHGVGDDPHLPVMHVSPQRLRAQLSHLAARHRVIPLRELAARWRSGASTRGCVALTFDDAYLGVAEHALPILRELDLTATVFVASDHAEVGATYWWDDAEHERIAAAGGAWTGMPGRLALDVGSDEAAMVAVRSRVLARHAGRWPGGLASGGDTIWRSLRFDELRRLAADERIEFGVHTLSHPALPALPFAEQVAEMRDNLRLLEARLPRVLPIVAYPYGQYDRATVRAAREAGMIAGVTMEGRATGARPDVMTVPRVGAGDVHPPMSLARRLNRALRPALVLRNRSIHPRMPHDPADAPSRSGTS